MSPKYFSIKYFFNIFSLLLSFRFLFIFSLPVFKGHYLIPFSWGGRRRRRYLTLPIFSKEQKRVDAFAATNRINTSAHQTHHPSDGAGEALRILVNEASEIELEQYLNTKYHERTPDRTDYANGLKQK
jgi:hypothetical protein